MIQLFTWLRKKKPEPKAAVVPPKSASARPVRVSHLEPIARPPRAAYVRAPEVVVVEERVMLDPLNPLSPLNLVNPVSPFYSGGLGVAYEAPAAVEIAPVYESPSCMDSSPVYESPSYSPDPSPSFDCSSSSFDASSSIDYGSSGSSDWS